MKRVIGFTLIELIVALGLISAVLLLAAPDLRQMLQNNRQSSDAAAFVVRLNYARSEAVKRKLNVVLCPSASGSSCLTNKEWESGWLIFVDVDTDGSLDTTTTPPDVILRIHGELANGTTLRATSGSDFESMITYSPRGFISGGTGNLILCDSRGLALAKSIAINLAGRVQLARNSDTGLFSSCAGAP